MLASRECTEALWLIHLELWSCGAVAGSREFAHEGGRDVLKQRELAGERFDHRRQTLH
jgi:hypothetical protein